jgi:peptide/nickel transport system substrate-binding protein
LSAGAALALVLPALTMTSAAEARPSAHAAAAMGASLTVAIQGAPQSLDPSKDDNGDGLYAAELLYAPVIFNTYAGTYTSSLATSWHYIGSGNKTFEFTVRSGAKFSDGEPVTAAAVAAGLLYTAHGSGPAGANFNGLTATAKGDTVVLSVKSPVANFPEFLDQRNLTGDVVCPSALKHPAALASEPCGAGPYVLDSSATIAGSKYVFTPNPYYFNPSGIHYKMITLQVISSTTSALDALRTGQANVDYDTTTGMYAPAKAAGLVVQTLGENNFVPIWIMDRFGTLDKALGSLDVREALNYAVNRPAIAKATFGSLGEPLDEPATPGYGGYNPAVAHVYNYNPAKAKQLLAKAGYPNGFSFTVEYINSQPQAGIALQAVAQEYAAIGVKMTLLPESGFPAFSAAQATKKYAAFTLVWGSGDITGYANLLWVSHSGANAFYATTPAFLDLFQAAQGAAQSRYVKAVDAITAYLVRQAWSVPICAGRGFMISTKGVNGLPPPGNALPGGLDITALHP